MGARFAFSTIDSRPPPANPNTVHLRITTDCWNEVCGCGTRSCSALLLPKLDIFFLTTRALMRFFRGGSRPWAMCWIIAA